MPSPNLQSLEQISLDFSWLFLGLLCLALTSFLYANLLDLRVRAFVYY